MSECIAQVKERLRKNKNIFIFGCVFIAVGIALGIFYIFNTYAYFGFYDNIYRMYNEWFSYYSSPMRLLFKRLFYNLVYIIIFVLLSKNKFLLPIGYIMLLYRGFVLGIGIIIFYNIYSISGIITIIILLIPQSIVVSLSCLGVMSVLLGDCKGSNFYITAGICGYLLCVAVSLYELLILVLFLRPTLFYF